MTAAFLGAVVTVAAVVFVLWPLFVPRRRGTGGAAGVTGAPPGGTRCARCGATSHEPGAAFCTSCGGNLGAGRG